MLRSSARRSAGFGAVLGLLTLALSACGGETRAEPLIGQEPTAGTEASVPTAQACGTEANPCALEGIRVIVSRNG